MRINSTDVQPSMSVPRGVEARIQVSMIERRSVNQTRCTPLTRIADEVHHDPSLALLCCSWFATTSLTTLSNRCFDTLLLLHSNVPRYSSLLTSSPLAAILLAFRPRARIPILMLTAASCPHLLLHCNQHMILLRQLFAHHAPSSFL